MCSSQMYHQRLKNECYPCQARAVLQRFPRVQETLADVGGVQTSLAALEEQAKEFVRREQYDNEVALLAAKTEVEALETKAGDLEKLLDTQRKFCESLDANKESKETIVLLNTGLEALLGKVQGLESLCDELGSTKANLTDLQTASKTWEEQQENSNARINELQDKAGVLQVNLLEQSKQLAGHAASASAIQEELATKAGRDDTEKLQSDLHHLQQQAETFATVQQVDTMSKDMKEVQEGLNTAVGRMEDDAISASEGKSAASAELTAVLDAQQKQQAAVDDRLASIQDMLQSLQTNVDSSKCDSEQTVRARSR